ncbi:MAG TPA: protoporphyrinogen oxidase [Micromonosporaceae bacterium]|nr:protoporphyrinogen oxidase [Micromonosporaceae bacterium]
MSAHRRRVAVVGGGIAGLAAALRLRERLPQAQIVVYEQSRALGGKLRTGALAGVDGTLMQVETGADAFLCRDPAGGQSAAVRLARRVGLGDALVHPGTGAAAIAAGGALLPMPARTLLGVPTDLSTLDGVARARAELDRDGGRPLLAEGEDVAVGALVRRRLGDEVADRLVDPLLGGVYAGRADQLSLAATVPALAAACRTETTLLGAARRACRPPADGPVFATVQGGLSRLVEAVARELRRGPDPVELRLGWPVRGLVPTGSSGPALAAGSPRRVGAGRVRWRLVLSGPAAGSPADDEVDGVLLALPTPRAARLLRGVDATAAAELEELEYASLALVTLALPPTGLPDLSGFLVPATEGYAVKAATFFTRKWGHLRRPDGTVLVRASIGRHGEELLLHATDAHLVELAQRELAALLGHPLPAPVATVVTRWGGALPQYPPGHVDRVARVRQALRRAGPLALAGAGYDGVGIPACITSGEAAADEVAAALLGEWAA